MSTTLKHQCDILAARAMGKVIEARVRGEGLWLEVTDDSDYQFDFCHLSFRVRPDAHQRWIVYQIDGAAEGVLHTSPTSATRRAIELNERDHTSKWAIGRVELCPRAP